MKFLRWLFGVTDSEDEEIVNESGIYQIPTDIGEEIEQDYAVDTPEQEQAMSDFEKARFTDGLVLNDDWGE